MHMAVDLINQLDISNVKILIKFSTEKQKQETKILEAVLVVICVYSLYWQAIDYCYNIWVNVYVECTKARKH